MSIAHSLWPKRFVVRLPGTAQFFSVQALLGGGAWALRPAAQRAASASYDATRAA
jgi:hypothetical protein